MQAKKRSLVNFLTLLFFSPQVCSFAAHPRNRRFSVVGGLQSSSTGNDVGSMRVAELREELKGLGIDYSDCFDKESLVVRLKDARAGTIKARPPAPQPSPSPATTTTTRSAPEPDAPGQKPSDDLVKEIRAMTVKDLRQELASRNLRWAGLLEKEDLVQAVLKARQATAHFSATGKISPGQAVTLTGEEVEVELQSGISTPLLLDVYAVWCGPCQIMAPQLQLAAADLGGRVRVVKMDSDKYPQQAGAQRVQGLPTLVLFKDGKEVDRLEGALMKDKLVQWVESRL